MRSTTITFLASLLLTFTLHAATDQTVETTPAQRAREGRTVIVHPTRVLTDADRLTLRRHGVFVKHALAGDRYLARVADGVQVADDRIARVEPLTAAHKIHASAYAAAARRSSFTAQVMFQRDVDFDAAREAILAAGGTLDPLKVAFSPSKRVDARLSPPALAALAEDDRVFTIAAKRNWRVRSDNATTALLSDVTLVHQAPYGLTGAGVAVSLFELAAAEASHVEFGGRLTVEEVPGGGSSDSLHATHVAGTIAASGINAAAKGMAPGATLFEFCVAGPNDCETDWLDEKDDQLHTRGVAVDNNSWGYVLGWTDEDGFPVWLDADIYYGAYEFDVTAPIDEISIERSVLFVHSAGNDGSPQQFPNIDSEHRHVDDEGDTITNKVFCYSRNGSGTDCTPSICTGGCETVKHSKDAPFDTIGVTAAAKNILTVGNLSSIGPAISPGSSRGPAKDGRVKPDVVARGSNVLSTVPGGGYQRLSGTSMAAPAVTGIAALLTEQWRKTFGTSPLPAHLKAVILAGAVDFGNPGPDYTYGFGLVNAKNSADIILADAGQGSRISTFDLQHGQSTELKIVVPETQNFRAVLHWPDPAIALFGSDGIAAKALVNDLDLRVVDPSGTEHRAWVLDKNVPNANATRGVNSVDNSEMVEIAAAVPGIYRVIVTGSAVREGSQKAVLVTSARTARPCRDLQELAAGSNDTEQTAYGDLVGGQAVNAGLCADGDVDYYRFTVTKPGPVRIVVTAGDTAVRVALTGGPVNTADVIPANTTATVDADVTVVPASLLVRIEASGTVGAEPFYSFVPQFGQAPGPRRRAAR